MTSNRSKTHEKNFLSLNSKLLVSQVCSLSFPYIAYSESVQQCLTSSRGKKKKFEPKGLKSGLKLGFLLFSQVWFINFPKNCIG